MSKYKMGDVFDLPIFNNSHTYGSGLSISVISDNYCNDVISGESDLTNNEVDCICEAVNNYDKNQDRIKELESLLKFTKDALFRDQFVVDTVWFDENTTLYDQIELTLEQTV